MPSHEQQSNSKKPISQLSLILNLLKKINLMYGELDVEIGINAKQSIDLVAQSSEIALQGITAKEDESNKSMAGNRQALDAENQELVNYRKQLILAQHGIEARVLQLSDIGIFQSNPTSETKRIVDGVLSNSEAILQWFKIM